MNLLYTFDNNYVQHAIASMVSICRTNSWDKDLTFYALIDSLTEKNLHVLKSLADSYPCTVITTEINGFMSSFIPGFDTKGWNEVIMARLLVNRFIPHDIDRILYLDGDTIVRGSLKEIWETDLEEYCVGAVVEPTVSKETKRRLGLENSLYFNSGVLLIDLNRWREKQIEEKLLSLCAHNGNKLTAGDQDALNMTLGGSFKVLSPTYNYANSFYYYPYRIIAESEKSSEFISEREFRSIQTNPIIVHYLGEDRPWRRGNTHRFASDYWKNVELSPYAPYATEEEGWELYFRAWRIFNTLVFPFPRIRLWILRALIPLFLQYRALKRSRNS